MQTFRSLRIYSIKAMNVYEDNALDSPAEADVGNCPPHGKQAGERTSAQATLLGMYLAVQSQLPTLRKRLQENGKHNRHAQGGFSTGTGQCCGED